MLNHSHRKAIVILAVVLIASCSTLLPLAQSSNRARAGNVSASSQQQPVLSRSDISAAVEVLTRLRSLRDCWSDPYMVVSSDDPRFENDSLYQRCGRNYQLRLVEAREAVGRTLTTIRNLNLRHEVSTAMSVFNDLDDLYRLFERRDYFFMSTVRVSDIYPIVRKYNIPYQEDSISKVAVYRAVIPHRRIHIDRLAALIPDTPRDNNPTLTPEQAVAANDDLAWSIIEQKGEGYDWYLRHYPQGRHASEARRMLDQLNTTRSEQNAHLTAIRDELNVIVKNTIKAYISGDRAAFERLLAPEFPNRTDYISRLRPQPEVISFEIRGLTIQPLSQRPAHYLALLSVLYNGTGGRQRVYDNRITYSKSDGHWHIIKWQSP
jgi:hypothetical protein